jgi:hypothetical protein
VIERDLTAFGGEAGRLVRLKVLCLVGAYSRLPVGEVVVDGEATQERKEGEDSKRERRLSTPSRNSRNLSRWLLLDDHARHEGDPLALPLCSSFQFADKLLFDFFLRVRAAVDRSRRL